ncbi:hypothetical protein BGW39_004438 [Mortierella sp. 14UC]|nr:hypothetical protein BGW39_004438 [Mortierella sp. 14UC]
MTVPPEPPLQEQTLIAYLFERLLFDAIERDNKRTGTFFPPAMLAAKFAYISHYYDELSLKQTHRYRGRAITRLGLDSVSGIIAFLTNYRNRFKILPDRVTNKIEFGEEAGKELCIFINCPLVSATDMVDIRRAFITRVPEAYREEVEFLMSLLKRSGLLASSEADVVQAGYECILELKRKENHHAVSGVYIDKLEAERPPPHVRKRKEEQLVAAIKALTYMDVLVLSSWTKGIHISDYDLELLLVEPNTTTTGLEQEKTVSAPSVITTPTDNDLAERVNRMSMEQLPPSGEERVRAIHKMATTVKDAGFELVLLRKRYFDITCKINPHYVCFYDPKTELTCQITLYNPFDIHKRELLRTYASIDNRVEPFVFAVQRTLDNHGRSHEALSNYAAAMIAIHFLQHKSILPKLMHHQGQRIDFGFHTGKAADALPKTLDTAFGTREISAIVQPELSTNKTRRGRGGNRNQGGPGRAVSDGREASSVDTLIDNAVTLRPEVRPASGAKHATLLRTTTSFHPEFLAVSHHYDKNLAKNRPFDRTRAKKPVVDLLVEFFEYTASKFKSWERYLPTVEDMAANNYDIVGSVDHQGKKCSMYMPGTARTFTSENFSGLVVQDPFVLDRNIAWLCTGWRFKSTSQVFQRARDSTSCNHKDKTHQELMLIKEESEKEGMIDTKVFDAWDSFGEAVAGSSLKNVAELAIATSFIVQEVKENGMPL